VAKVLDPLHSAEARGRVGGLVYNTWRGIHTVKTHTDPAHQDDPKRQAHKAIVQAAGIRWRSLTAAQRAGWSDYAAAHPQLDWTGKPQRIAGYHWYVRIQTVRQDIGEGYDDDPPTLPNVATFSTFEAVEDEGDLVVNWSYQSPDWDWDGYMDTWLAGPFTAGRSPSIHDARRNFIEDAFTGTYAIDSLAAGFYTVFARLVRDNGLVGVWEKAGPVEIEA
jgi:hypothetical protein